MRPSRMEDRLAIDVWNRAGGRRVTLGDVEAHLAALLAHPPGGAVGSLQRARGRGVDTLL